MGDNSTLTSSLAYVNMTPTTSTTTNVQNMFIDTISNLSNFFADNQSDSSNRSNASLRGGPPGNSMFMMAQIPFYVLIFLLSVVGNILVIVTVIQNKKMRSLTNVFLLNLSVSDLLLSVFCMPFTLIPVYLKDFIFGEVMCVLVRYLQGFYDNWRGGGDDYCVYIDQSGLSSLYRTKWGEYYFTPWSEVAHRSSSLPSILWPRIVDKYLSVTGAAAASISTPSPLPSRGSVSKPWGVPSMVIRPVNRTIAPHHGESPLVPVGLAIRLGLFH
ncbi:cholecystokinin receptor type A [Elysia marginata]|uniref:Cholecystokinin receptor type A n=1 Tax=Elysia marginata TaxID=1093978 RepID=A0AAV4JD09_9GAST|nr:cholecystokinin receptor type A [Elysia marginata]